MDQRIQQVLLVEDDADVRELLQTVLAHAGYTVTAIDDGQTAKVMLETTCYDLLITDYHLPDICGNMLIVYAQAACPTMATVLMSAHPHVEHLASLCNAHAWFHKGGSLNGFLVAVTVAFDAVRSCP